MDELLRTDPSKPWTTFHSRALEHKGCILDLGCSGWDWSRFFFGNKPVIGLDPQEETEPQGSKLIKAIAGPTDGEITLHGSGDAASVPLASAGRPRKVQMVSFESLIQKYSPISILKMNIEGMEYDLLKDLNHPIADQMVIAFHDRRGQLPSNLTDEIIKKLGQWYESFCTDRKFRWYLFLLREDYRG